MYIKFHIEIEGMPIFSLYLYKFINSSKTCKTFAYTNLIDFTAVPKITVNFFLLK